MPYTYVQLMWLVLIKLNGRGQILPRLNSRKAKRKTQCLIMV